MSRTSAQQPVTVENSQIPFPPFVPARLLRGGHAQTLAGAYLPGHQFAYRAQQRRVTLDDGDQLVLHDDCPEGWQAGDRAALMIHGLAGNHTSGYMLRIAHKLAARGVRAFRMDLRGCGAGMTLARLPYHSGRSEDAAGALRAIAEWLPGSPTTLIGFSLGANIALKLAGELRESACGGLDSVVSVCPPVDLAACSRRMSRAANRLYERHFIAHLLQQLNERQRLNPTAAHASFARQPRSIWEFDDKFTAAICGFGTADNYYRAASSLGLLAHIELPTLILAAADDPMIACDALASAALPPSVQLHLSPHGGHLGFVGRAGIDADRRWMDWRVVDWVATRGCCRGAVRAHPGPKLLREIS